MEYSVTTGGAFDYARPMTQIEEESVGEIVWQPETDPAPNRVRRPSMPRADRNPNKKQRPMRKFASTLFCFCAD